MVLYLSWLLEDICRALSAADGVVVLMVVLLIVCLQMYVVVDGVLVSYRLCMKICLEPSRPLMELLWKPLYIYMHIHRYVYTPKYNFVIVYTK